LLKTTASQPSVKSLPKLPHFHRIKVLATINLADPDLLWSLYKKKGQMTLHYLYQTYGVTWFEALRRIILDPIGIRYSLYLSLNTDGSWKTLYRRLDRSRFHVSPALGVAG
jgi:hypothetical protein